MSLEELLSDVPELDNPVLVLAFEGWNDAGEAATGAIDHLLEVWEAQWIGDIDPEEYYDFQVNRPQVVLDDEGNRELVWPSTRLYHARPATAHRDILLLRGIEPNNRWQAFTTEVLTIIRDLDVELVVTLGSMLAETPHTRPIPVNCTASTEELRRKHGFEPSRYEGPTGIVGVITTACAHAEVPAVSLWAAIPHYFSQPPSPKGALAIVAALENVLDFEISVAELPEEAHVWETDVDELAADNDEVLSYVHQLEASHDAETPEATSGDDIAAEFERYLRRRGNS